MINEAILAPLKLNFGSWKEVLVLTSQNANIDRLAAALAVYLALGKMGKKVQIATEANLTVSQTQLFGIGEITNRFPQLKGGDMTLTLENVVIDQGPDAGKVPALEKLDWFPEDKDLKLVFHVVPGQRFEPQNVSVTYAQGKFDAMIVIGAATLENLGRIYGANKATFSGSEVVNIDNQAQNSQFGSINIVDQSAGTISEMVVNIFNHLGVGMDEDMASNILSGIYNATHNLTQKMTAETFLAIGQAMQVGGKVPQMNRGGSGAGGFQSSGSGQFKVNTINNRQQPQQQPQNNSPVRVNRPNEPKKENPFLAPVSTETNFNPVFQPKFVDTTAAQQVAEVGNEESVKEEGFDLKSFNDNKLNSTTEINLSTPANNPVAEATDEEEMGTDAEFSPAPDWLTPKVYKSGGLG